MDDEHNQRILAEVDRLLRTAPTELDFYNPQEDHYEWLGNASAIFDSFARTSIDVIHAARDLASGKATGEARNTVLHALRTLKHDFRIKYSDSDSKPFSVGEQFRYFDHVRGLIVGATKDVMFVDPYLDAEFVSRYRTQIKSGVAIRLLTAKKSHFPGFVAAVDMFVKQENAVVEVRTNNSLHDRWIFIDGLEGFFSGASFKDGATASNTSIQQVKDTFLNVSKSYEDLWLQSSVER